MKPVKGKANLKCVFGHCQICHYEASQRSIKFQTLFWSLYNMIDIMKPVKGKANFKHVLVIVRDVIIKLVKGKAHFKHVVVIVIDIILD